MGSIALAILSIGLAFVGTYKELNGGGSNGWQLAAFICMCICIISALNCNKNENSTEE